MISTMNLHHRIGFNFNPKFFIPLSFNFKPKFFISLSVAPRHLISTSAKSSLNVKTETTKFITAPIFYVNATPHAGHLYSTLLGDMLKRWYEMKGLPSYFSVGTDEHGLKIQQAAQKARMDPLEFCNQVSGSFRDLFEKAVIEPSVFIRTTEQRHKDAVCHLWKKLEKGGHIYKGFHEGWYSVSDETFVPESQIEERELEGKSIMVSKETGKPVEWTREENYKFRLESFRLPLIEWLTQNPNVIIPSNHYKDILKQLKERPLGDLSISRLKSRVSWGIPVPFDSDHVIYVWLDALTNYLTVCGYPTTSETSNNLPVWPASWHIVGQDIIKFHAIYWPAFLMAAGLAPPQRILAHGHWLVSNQKMSKSLGNGIDPTYLLAKYGSDAIRYFLIRDGGIENNPEFSVETIERRYKYDLAGQIGNLAMRSTSVKINPFGYVPDDFVADLNDQEVEIVEFCNSCRDQVDGLIEQGQFDQALDCISKLSSLVNKYFSQLEPWRFDVSQQDQKERLMNMLHVACESLRISGILLQPVMPNVSKKLLDTLKVPVGERGWGHAVFGACSVKKRVLVPSGILFPNLNLKSSKGK